MKALANLFAKKITEGKVEIENVPATIKSEVDEILSAEKQGELEETKESGGE